MIGQGHADVMASLLLAMLDGGQLKPLVKISNLIASSRRFCEAAALAGELLSKKFNDLSIS